MALASPVLLETLGSLPQACDTDIDDFLQQLFNAEHPESTPPVTRTCDLAAASMGKLLQVPPCTSTC